jgi:protein-S-isoprenylcysteine O-methyltransferase Ste14
MQSSCHKFRRTSEKNGLWPCNGTVEMTFRGAGSNSKVRIMHSRLFALLIFLLLMVSGSKMESGLGHSLIDFAGLACVIVCAFGRVWSSIYISGHKTTTLVEFGPYSVTRNPLYLFSLIGIAGIGLASGSLLILALLTLSFGLYYPFIIRREEAGMKALHGRQFQAYMERVPGFLPNMSLYSEPDTCTVKTKQLRRALLDSSYFIWIYGAVQLIQKLHEADILPVLFKIP